MADLSKVKRNVAKMVSMDAPESDIDDYIKSEGVTIDEVRAHKASSSLIPSEKGSVGYNTQALPGGVESLARGVVGFGGQILGGLAGATEGLMSSDKTIFGQGAKRAEQAGQAVESIPRIFSTTKDIENEILGPSMHWIRDRVGQVAENSVSMGRMGEITKGTGVPEAMRTIGEVGFDVSGAAALGAGTGRMMTRRPAETGIKAVEEAPKAPTPEAPRGDMFFDDSIARAQEILQKRREAAQGELTTTSEQRAFLDRELSGQRDMFSEPNFGRRPETGLETRPDRLPPPEVALTPEQVKAAQEGRPYVPYEPDHPTMGMGATTSRGASPRPLEEVPAVSFEPSRPFVGREEFTGTTGFQIADARVAEAIAGDSYLKGMQSRLARMEENLKGIGEMQGEVHQRYGQRRVEGGSGQRTAQELVAYTKSMKAVEKDIAALKEKIDNRVKMHEERVRKQPKYEKTLDPFKKGPSSLPKGRPGGKQAGAINPEVFREGFQKIKELVGGRKLVAYSTRDEYGPVFRVSTRGPDGAELGSADFIPTRGGLKMMKDRDLMSALTEVDPRVQRQGLATEMYKFAAELGNDIVPSTAQTLEGKAMWQGFKAKQVPLRQRGAANFGVGEKVAGIIDKLRAKNDSNTPPIGKVYEGRDAILKAAEGEVRSPAQAVADIGIENIKELPTTGFQKGLQWLSNAQMVFNETKNPFVRYIADFASNIKQESILYHEVLTQGIKFGSGRLPRKIVDPNSPAGVWNSISHFDKRVVSDIINKFNGVEWPTRDQIVAMGGKEKHAKILEILQKPLNDLWNKLNEERIANGREPLPYRPFYFMKAQGFGPFMVRVKDADGVTLAFHRTETKWGQKHIGEELKKQFPEQEGLKVEYDIANRATRGNKYNISTTLLEEVYAALDKADPRREAITSAIAEIKSKGGFAVHGAKRKNVGGMDLSPKNFWDTYDAYIKDGANYIGNQKLLKAIKDIEKMQEIPKELRKWSMDHLNLNRGGKLDNLMGDVEATLDWVVGAPGRFRQVNNALGRAFLTSQLLFWRPPFLVGQALQSTGFAPMALANWKYEMGYNKGSTMKAFIEGSTSFLTKDKEFKTMVDFLAARGKLDPTLVADISLFGKGTSLGPKILDHISGASASRFLETVGRMHAASIGMNFLKQNGLKGKELQLATERFIDDVMGNYSMSDRPGLIQRTGVAGEMMRPLSTFQNYFYGSTILTLKHAVEGIASGNFKRAIPFVTQWASMAALGGLLSAPFMKELDALFTWIKKLEDPFQIGAGFRAAWKATTGETLNAASPGMTERLLTSDIPDYGTMGLVTGATQLFDERGIHIAGSLASPEMMPSVVNWGWKGLAPGIGFGTDLVSALSTIIGDLTGSDKTVEEKRKAFKTLAPGIFDKLLENYDFDFQAGSNPMDGKIGFEDRPVPGGARGYGSVRRDGFETTASILGAGTIPEYKEKTAMRDFKEDNLDIAAQKNRLVDLGIDAIQRGETEKLATYMQKALELGFQDYTESIQTAMMKRYLSESERSRIGNQRDLRKFEYREKARESR